MKNTIIFLCLSLCVACVGDNKIPSFETADKYTIDIAALIDNEEEYDSIDNIVDSMRFTTLNSDNKVWHSPIGLTMLKYKDDFIVFNMIPKQLTVIYDSMGNIRRNISRIGRGPSELEWCMDMFANKNIDMLCLRNLNKIVINNFNGDHIRDVKLGKQVPIINHIKLLNSGHFVATPLYSTNDKSNPVPHLIFLNSSGEIIKSIYHDSPQIMDQKPLDEYKQDNTIVYEVSTLTSNYLGEVLYRDKFDNIIYKITDKDSISPYIELKLGKYTPMPKDANNPNLNRKKVYIRSVDETSKYIFLSYMYEGETYSVILNKPANDVVYYTKHNKNLGKKGQQAILYQTSQFEELINIYHYDENRVYGIINESQTTQLIQNTTTEDNYTIVTFDLR